MKNSYIFSCNWVGQIIFASHAGNKQTLLSCFSYHTAVSLSRCIQMPLVPFCVSVINCSENDLRGLVILLQCLVAKPSLNIIFFLVEAWRYIERNYHKNNWHLAKTPPPLRCGSYVWLTRRYDWSDQLSTQLSLFLTLITFNS